jgi:hypothetical protein
MAVVRRLVLYGTLGCHLCEVARTRTAPVAEAFGWRLEERDVADDDALAARYGERIPVLARGDRSGELAWPFETDAIVAYLSLPAEAE